MGGASGAGVLLAACGGSSDSGSGSGSDSGAQSPAAGGVKKPSGPWTFTDDRKKAVTLDRTPDRTSSPTSVPRPPCTTTASNVTGVFGPTSSRTARPTRRPATSTSRR